jgi:hypothetical protein
MEARMTQRIEQIDSAQTELTADTHDRMRVLIAELVQTNQELRFKIARLKEQIARLEKGLPAEVPWAGMLI